MMERTCKQCYHYCHITRGIEMPYTEIHHCSRKEKDLGDITEGCFYFSERKVVDDIPHNPDAKSTGLYDCRGNELFDGDYIFIPDSQLERQRVAQIVWDEQYKCWAVQSQPPFNKREIGLTAYVVNILPWITPAAYKVTEKRIIDMYH